MVPRLVLYLVLFLLSSLCSPLGSLCLSRVLGAYKHEQVYETTGKSSWWSVAESPDKLYCIKVTRTRDLLGGCVVNGTTVIRYRNDNSRHPHLKKPIPSLLLLRRIPENPAPAVMQILATEDIRFRGDQKILAAIFAMISHEESIPRSILFPFDFFVSHVFFSN